MDNYDKTIDVLKSNDYYKVKKIIASLINNEEFINRIVHEKNPFAFDHFIKMCEYQVDTSSIYERRNHFIKKIMNTINEENCFELLNLSNIDMILVNRYLIEYIICYYFQDSYYNFMVNFHQMISYLRYCGKKLVNEDNIKLYSQFLDLKVMSFADKIKFFNEHLNSNIMEMFYDDIDIIRTDSHKELVDNSLKLTKDSPIYQKEMSERLNVNVYMLNGESFYGFVRCLSIPRGTYLFNFFDYVNSIGKRLGYSFSYIGDKNIGTIDYDGKNVTLFYDNIDYKNIMYVHHADLHSNKMDKQDDYLSVKENEILMPNSLIAHTNNYNEIYIKSGGKEIRPKALVCYDLITDNDIGFARKYNLAILLINREKYRRYEMYDENYDDNTYVI